MLQTTLLCLALAALTSAHTAAWAPGMYCRGGADPNKDDQNTNLVVNPLYQLSKADWWFQHDRGCDAVPPKAGEFLELPANGEVTVELAHNRAFTTLSYKGDLVSNWPDGKDHPEDWNGWQTDGTPAVCLKDDGALHTYNETSAGGTAFAISYNSNIKDVTMENLVVFSTLYHTPWKRLATYKVPDLAACPPGGCTCAWLWIPNGCGQANMYMQGFKCNVTGASSTAAPLAKAQAPVFCENEPSKCVKGAKQMLAWQQATGNNIETAQWVTPNYNQKCGWAEGAQTDIFEKKAVPASNPSTSTVTPPASYSEAFSAKPFTSTSVVPPPASYSEAFSAAPFTSVPAIPTPVSNSEVFSGIPFPSAPPPALYTDYFSADPFTSTPAIPTPVSKSEVFSGIPFPSAPPPALYTDYFSAAPFSTPSAQPSASTLVTLVSSVSSVAATAIKSTVSSAASLSATKTTTASAVAASSKTSSAARPVKTCYRRRPWRRCRY